MSYQIYIDSLFLVNFCIYFLLLTLVSLLKPGAMPKVRMAIAALSGASISCAGLMLAAFNGNLLKITPVLTYGLPVVAMVAIVNKSLKASILLKDAILLYIMSFILGGMMDFLKNRLSFFREHVTGIWLIILLACICTIAISSVISKWKTQILENTFEVTVSINDLDVKTHSITALCDSGNSLVDPFSQKSVSVVEKAALGIDTKFMEKFDGYRLIPFRSVGNNFGLMECIRAASVSIKNRDGYEVKKMDVILGLYDGKLSQSNKYRMLLHPNWIA